MRLLRPPERLGRILVLLLACNTKVRPDILRRLSHWLHAIRCLLVAKHLLVEWTRQAIATGGHQLRTDGNTNVNGTELDLVRNILYSLETRGAESVHGGSTSRVRDTSCEGGGTDEVGCFTITNLVVAGIRTGCDVRKGSTYISQAHILNQGGIHLGLGEHFLEKRIYHVIQLRILESTLAGLCERRAQREGDDYIVWVLLSAVGAD